MEVALHHAPLAHGDGPALDVLVGAGALAFAKAQGFPEQNLLMLWTAESSAGGKQLWRSDGSRPGTFALTGPELNVPPLQAFLHRSFYFVGCSGPGGADDCGLWRTDGTAAGTDVLELAERLLATLPDEQAAPALTITREQLDAGLEVVESVIAGSIIVVAVANIARPEAPNGNLPSTGSKPLPARAPC